MSDINYIFNNFAAVLVKNGEILEVKSDEKPELFQRVVNLCMTGEKEAAFDLIIDSSNVRFMATRLAEITDGMLFVTDADEVVFRTTDGRVLPIVDTFAARIREAWEQRDNAALEVYKKFMIKASNNPNDVSASDLFEFITVNKLPLSIDGEVLAYKIVRNDFRDIHSGTKDHTPGNEVTEDNVDYNRDVTCSNGLHFCSKDYLPSYGGFFGSSDDTNRLVLVKIDPSDVAAFPRDYNNAKGRCRKYTVVSELPTALFTAVVELMEQVPFVDIAKLGAPQQVTTRLGEQVRQHATTIVKQAPVSSNLLLNSIVVGGARWYVTVEADNQPKKFVFQAASRSAAREVVEKLRLEVADNESKSGSYLGMTNIIVKLYDDWA